jgi:hypothetical protein
LVNIPDRCVEVYRSPVPAEAVYAVRTDYRTGEILQFELAPEVFFEASVADVLP